LARARAIVALVRTGIELIARLLADNDTRPLRQRLVDNVTVVAAVVFLRLHRRNRGSEQQDCGRATHRITTC
jgi:hypothetical protein